MTVKPDLTRVWAAGAPGANVVDPDTTTPGKYDAGWVAEIPPFEHFNFLQQLFTQGLAHNNEQGINVWDTLTDYPVDALSKGSDGVVYVSVVTPNIGNDPVASPTDWIATLITETDVDSIADLRLTPGGSGRQKAFVKSHNPPNFALANPYDGGGGSFVWDNTSTETDDGGIIIKVTAITTGRWIRIFQGPIDIKWFGAVGDGTTDDAPAIQATIDAAPDYSEIIIPRGLVYAIGADGLLLSGRNGIRFIGGGTIKFTALTGQTLPDGSNDIGIKLITCVSCGFNNTIFDGNSINTSCIGITASTKCFVDTCEIKSWGTVPAIKTINNDGTRISDNYLHDAVGIGQGVWLGNYGANLLERDVLVYGNTVIDLKATGIVLSSTGGRCFGNHAQVNGADGSGIIFGGANGFASSDLSIYGNTCKRNPYFGIQCDVAYTTDADLPQNITITNNICVENDQSGIYGVNIENSIISSNVCADNNFDDSGNGYGIVLSLISRKVIVADNRCYDSRVGGARTQVAGIFSDPQTVGADVSDIGISGNICSNHTLYGIAITQVASTAVIDSLKLIGNTCNDNSSRGILMTAATQSQITNISVIGNTCRGNTTNDLQVSIDDAVISGNLYQSSTGLIQTLDDTGTPSVNSRELFDTGGTTAITDFDDGIIGQTIKIIASHAITITDGGPIILAGGANFVMAVSDTLTLTMFDNQVWQEVSRSVN